MKMNLLSPVAKAKTPPIPRIHILEERKRQCGVLLAQGKTVKSVARRLGVTEKTVWNYRQDPAVQKVIRETQVEFEDMGGGMAMMVIPDAIAVLQQIIADPDARDSDKIQAARTLMAGSANYQERQLLQRDIRDLRRQVNPETIEAVVVKECEEDE